MGKSEWGSEAKSDIEREGNERPYDSYLWGYDCAGSRGTCRGGLHNVLRWQDNNLSQNGDEIALHHSTRFDPLATVAQLVNSATHMLMLA